MSKIISRNLLVLLLLFTVTSCVTQRKYEELQTKYDKCSTDLTDIKQRVEALDTENKDLKSQVEELTKSNTKLSSDTALLGSSYRQMREQYDKINDLNALIQKQLEMLQKGSAQESTDLKTELEIMKADLLKKEDELRKLEAELNAKEDALKDKIKRIDDLQSTLAKKDAAVNALKDKVANALLGFKDKGLTVEQRNGKVYVSLEAKLLFASGSTVVDKEGKDALIKLAKVLQDQADLEIVVEGHTDTDKINSKTIPTNNWELSVLRSTSVVQIMLANSSIDPKILAASGRSEYIPVDPNDKSKNRRIEIILTPNLSELYKLLNE